jgi:hypothetical protein
MCSICVSMCSLSLSLSAVLIVAADPRYLGVDLHAHTLALSVSVSPLPGLSFSPLKRRCAAVIMIIEIQDSFVFGCSHFIKVALIRKYIYFFKTSVSCLLNFSLSLFSYFMNTFFKPSNLVENDNKLTKVISDLKIEDIRI